MAYSVGVEEHTSLSISFFFSFFENAPAPDTIADAPRHSAVYALISFISYVTGRMDQISLEHRLSDWLTYIADFSSFTDFTGFRGKASPQHNEDAHTNNPCPVKFV